MPPEIAARIAAGQELRRRGKLSPEQDAALRELERRYPGDAVNTAMAVGDTASARVVAEDQEALRAESGVRPTTGPTGAGRTWEVDPRVRGREEGREWSPIGAAGQGAGSMMFGVGTPATAAASMITSLLPGGEEPMGPGEAMEYARGVREGAYEAHPNAYRVGAVGGLANIPSFTRNVVKSLPAAARNVFSLQAGQTARNIGRTAAAGAVASGTTAGLEEGAEAVPFAAGVGAVFGPAAGAATSYAVRAGRGVMSWIKPDNAAIRVLAKRLGESADAVATRYNDFVRTMGRKPRLIEIMRRESAEELGEISRSKVGTEAARVFREAEEQTARARPRELRAQVERGGRTTTLPEQVEELAPITEETRRLYPANAKPSAARVQSSATAQETRRNASMDRVMQRIGDHYVHMTEEMRDVMIHPDVQGVLPGPLKRRLNEAIEKGIDLGSIDIPLHVWEKARYEMAKRAGGPGASQIYSEYRNRIRDYVGGRVPEYARALREFGRRTVGAESTTAAERAVKGSAREFADMLRKVSSEPHGATARAGSRVGVRNWLANQLDGPPRQAALVMERLARDNRLRANLRQTLSRNEMIELEALAERYGHHLNIIEGVKTGARVVTGDADRFVDAARAAATTRGGEIGVRAGARGALANKAGESPAAASAVATAVAENPGLQERLAVSLGGRETSRLRKIAETTVAAERNLTAATPRATQAQLERQRQSQAIQEVITAGVAATGTASGALKANLLNNIQQRLRLNTKTARRLAEIAVDPNQAHIFINRMRAANVASEELLRWYRDAAVAAGIATGAGLSN